MITEDGTDILCDQTQCGAFVKNNAWAKIKSQDTGWLFLRDGRAFCPEHTPPWLESWRKKRETKIASHCPRCDKQFAADSYQEANTMMEEHVALAHKDYVELMEE